MYSTVRDIKIEDCPQDTISSICMSQVNGMQFVIGSSWSKDVFIYSVDQSNQAKQLKITQAKAPVLTTAIDSQRHAIFFGGFDNTITAWDVASGQQVVVGEHQSPVKSVKLLPAMNILVSSGFDNVVKYWDVRQNSRTPAMQLQQPDKAICMDVHAASNQMIVGHHRGRYSYVNLQNPSSIVSSGSVDNSMQTSAIAVIPSGGFAIGSVEGRVVLEYNNPKKTFPFRCHRSSSSLATDVHGISSLSFHPTTGILATAGNDGHHIFWDHVAEKKLKQFDKIATPISATAFNEDGSLYAYAGSYNWHQGYNKSPQKHCIYIHKCTKDEVAGKQR